MSDFKGVRVLGQASGGQYGSIGDHVGAHKFVIDSGGHLLVVGASNKTVAAYAPGKWNGVEVVE